MSTPGEKRKQALKRLLDPNTEKGKERLKKLEQRINDNLQILESQDASANLMDAKREAAKVKTEIAPDSPDAIVQFKKRQLAEEDAEDVARRKAKRLEREESDRQLIANIANFRGDNNQNTETNSVDSNSMSRSDDDEWTYVGGDAKTSNERYKDIKEMVNETVVKDIVTRKEYTPTGSTDLEVWSKNSNGVRDKYSNFDEFREAAQAWRDGQAIDVVEQVTEEVPVEKIRRITQSRDDFQKVNTEWVNGMNWGAMSTKLGDRFDADTLKNKALELGSYEKMVKWAKQNAPEIVSSGGSRPGFTKTTIEKGKTNWSDG
jgi:hypothetical protein